MNIIRTPVVELTKARALAYKYKMSSGGAGIKILYSDTGKTETYTVGKRGELTADRAGAGGGDAAEEACELTRGLPYSARGKVRAVAVEQAEEDEAVPETPGYDMVESPEYKAWVAAYVGPDGRMSYAKMNKDLIQFASRNKTVSQMVAEKEPRESILLRIVQIQTSNLTGNKEYMASEAAGALIGTLEELDVRSAFKELKLHITRMLGGKK
ncbi:MAG: hypothetical protein LBH95_00855 [Oscillospiraceae bacterium]|jgi:hypothetical protein|nr:hypothetical protein [Oscillospiraceae bacterium]